MNSDIEAAAKRIEGLHWGLSQSQAEIAARTVYEAMIELGYSKPALAPSTLLSPEEVRALVDRRRGQVPYRGKERRARRDNPFEQHDREHHV